MTNHVTDTNVGKMTEQEAIEHIDVIRNTLNDARNEGLHYQSYSNIWDLIDEIELFIQTMAIEALQFQQSVVMCKDCTEYDIKLHACLLYDSIKSKNDYCSRGERRDEK